MKLTSLQQSIKFLFYVLYIAYIKSLNQVTLLNFNNIRIANDNYGQKI